MNTVTTSPENHRASVRFFGRVSIILIFIIVIEIFSFIAIRHVIIPADSSLIYVPPVIDPVVYESYLEHRHPVLGWSTATPERRYSAKAESRPNPTFPNTDSSCVSIYGDSFTFGSEVNDDEAWGNVLSAMLDCKVANFGLGGYGMDQAYLRYKLNDSDQSAISVLGIYPDDVLRNLNQYRPFLAGSSANFVGLKPRFVIKDNKMQLIPPPKFSYEELVEAVTTPTLSFPYETFLPGSEHGSQKLSFPYTLTLFRVVRSKSIRAFIQRQPTWMAYLKDEHSTDALKISDHITKNFAKKATDRNKRSLVVIFPTPASTRYYKRTGALATQPLSDMLQRSGIVHLDLQQGISDYLVGRSFCEILTNVEGCSGHYNAEGNGLVASLLKTKIELMNK